MLIGTFKFVASLLLRWCCHVGEWMIAGYRTLPVGKMVLLHWLELQVGRHLRVVVHNRVLIASKLVKCYMVWLWHSGVPYSFAVLFCPKIKLCQ